MRIDHVRKVSIGFKRKYRLFTDDGNGRPGRATGYAEKRLTVADEFHLFRDETRERVLAVVSTQLVHHLFVDQLDPHDRAGAEHALPPPEVAVDLVTQDGSTT